MRGIKGLLKFPSVPIILVHAGLSHQPNEWTMIPLWLFCLDRLSASWFRSLGHTVISFKRQVFYKISSNEIEFPEVSGNFPTCFLFLGRVFGWRGHCHPLQLRRFHDHEANRRKGALHPKSGRCEFCVFAKHFLPKKWHWIDRHAYVWVWEVLLWLWISNYIPLVPQKRQFSCTSFLVDSALQIPLTVGNQLEILTS